LDEMPTSHQKLESASACVENESYRHCNTEYEKLMAAARPFNLRDAGIPSLFLVKL
jgi:hypothetical protein